MKRIAVVLSLTLFSIGLSRGFGAEEPAPAERAEGGKHLFILDGQSNMSSLDPNVSFTPTVTKKFGKDNVIVVKSSASGQPIWKWYKKWKPAVPGSEHYPITPKSKWNTYNSPGCFYDRLMSKVKRAIRGQKIQTVTFVWMQGESDAYRGHGKTYEVSLRGLLDQLKTDMKLKDLNFVIGRISDHVHKRFPDWDIVRKAQVAVAEADPRGTWVDTDDLNDGLSKSGKKLRNALHYGVEGSKVLGERFAKKAIELIEKEHKAANQ